MCRGLSLASLGAMKRASVRAMCVAAKFGFCVQAAKKYAFLVLQMGQPLRLAMLGTSPYTGEARVGAATAPLQERQGTRGPLPYFGKIASDFTEIHLTLALLARLRPHRGRQGLRRAASLPKYLRKIITLHRCFQKGRTPCGIPIERHIKRPPLFRGGRKVSSISRR